ncbi:hypothetical protein GTH52_05900 [Clostridium tyrobutyricum]|jgi:uncharacterized membrane protein|uniref:Uncharacterized protein n=1 Tax=Clostridium tyrobutyricum DIVETGP TaxID=1408889 RepID=W6N816_CLOTY|nr:hypothetical protein [Clostridium tyrobutyricum]AND84592.1 hypothetical protein CTK_C13310 [Clostridium tyrobutyricum]ANP69198.1 hypothetical protein BA182_05770 [Clostridium tyrobutyricum]MBR9648684.1 hypothetical protein [Clostridium tyrobutyricum]MBV4415577.1 hypothetical protein [Clostridium tyrobutyricum]MBV4421342.1 hypothetical protein [Clostridium tyrobutyricum]
MNFTYKNISLIWKIGLAIIIALVFIHILPFVIIAGIAIWGLVRCINYFKSKSKFRKSKEPFNKKVIDVKYREVSK